MTPPFPHAEPPPGGPLELIAARRRGRIDAVVAGASAGAIEVLSVVLPRLPADYPIPILAVVHAPRQRENTLVALFQARCAMRVKEAEDKEPIVGGTVYFAPPDYHLLVEPERCLSLSAEEPVLFCRPAIDVLFESAAAVFGERLAGIVFTGANEDGARGLEAVCAGGGLGVAQDPLSARVATMPLAALGACAGALSLTPARIADLLLLLPAAGGEEVGGCK